MTKNDGYRPREVESLEKRGLVQLRTKWKKFYEDALSSRIHAISNPQREILRSYGNLINTEIEGFLRFGKGRFTASSGTERMLKELDLVESEKVTNYIKYVRSFHAKLRKET